MRNQNSKSRNDRTTDNIITKKNYTAN